MPLVDQMAADGLDPLADRLTYLGASTVTGGAIATAAIGRIKALPQWADIGAAAGPGGSKIGSGENSCRCRRPKQGTLHADLPSLSPPEEAQ